MKSYEQPRQQIEKQRHYFASKVLSSLSYGFSSSHVWMWELDYKAGWVPKNSCFWTVVLEKTLERPLDCKESQSVHSKGNQSWIFIERTDGEAETPIVWSSDAKNWLIGKYQFWESLKAGGDGDDRGWDGWMASPTQWTRVCKTSGSWWWTGKPGVLQSMGSQRVAHHWATELSWTDVDIFIKFEEQCRCIKYINKIIWNRGFAHSISLRILIWYWSIVYTF